MERRDDSGQGHTSCSLDIIVEAGNALTVFIQDPFGIMETEILTTSVSLSSRSTPSTQPTNEYMLWETAFARRSRISRQTRRTLSPGLEAVEDLDTAHHPEGFCSATVSYVLGIPAYEHTSVPQSSTTDSCREG